MSEYIVDALDGAELVRATTIHGVQYVAVWHGGTGVNVYNVVNGVRNTWEEVAYFSLSDERGKPCERSEVESAMVEHFERVESEVIR